MTSEIGTNLPLGEFNTRQFYVSELMRNDIHIPSSFKDQTVMAIWYLYGLGADVKELIKEAREEKDLIAMAAGLARVFAASHRRK